MPVPPSEAAVEVQGRPAIDNFLSGAEDPHLRHPGVHGRPTASPAIRVGNCEEIAAIGRGAEQFQDCHQL
jgi:hypothetical protein